MPKRLWRQDAEMPDRRHLFKQQQFNGKLPVVQHIPDEELGDPYGPPQPRAIAKLYGERNLSKAMMRYSSTGVKQAAEGMGLASHGGKRDVIARIVRKVRSERA